MNGLGFELRFLEDETMRIEVTHADMTNGLRMNCTECPVSLALIRAGFVEPRATRNHVVHRVDGRWKETQFPDSVGEFILAYDMGAWAEPFSFEL